MLVPRFTCPAGDKEKASATAAKLEAKNKALQEENSVLKAEKSKLEAAAKGVSWNALANLGEKFKALSGLTAKFD